MFQPILFDEKRKQEKPEDIQQCQFQAENHVIKVDEKIHRECQKVNYEEITLDTNDEKKSD